MKNKIINILENGFKKNIDAVADSILDIINQPKTPRMQHKSYLDGKRIMKWCSRHKTYHPIEYFVPNENNEDGREPYCKAAQQKWEELCNFVKKASMKLTLSLNTMSEEERNKLATEVYEANHNKDRIETYTPIPYDSCEPKSLPIDDEVRAKLKAAKLEALESTNEMV